MYGSVVAATLAVLAGLLVLGYLFYQFGGKIMKMQNSIEDMDSRSRSRNNIRARTRSRSRSRSRSASRGKYLRRRAAGPRCSSCGMDHYLED